MSRWWGKLISLALLLLALTSLFGVMHWTAPERGRLSFIEIGLRDAMAPLVRGLALVVNTTEGWLAKVKDYGRLQAENEALRRQIAELKAANVRMEEYRLENERLRELLKYSEENSDRFDLTVAPVIGRSPSNWYNTITLGLGFMAGLQKGQVVLTHQGVVGRIIATTQYTAEVLLILDREGALGAMVQVNRTPGIVEGSPDYPGYLQMVRISRDAPVQEHHLVVTSGLGSVFPRGLLIGTVVKIIYEPDGLMKRAIIAPSVDFDRLEEVMVITGFREGSLDAATGADSFRPGSTSTGGDPVTGF
ncbi:MAG: rod shape-determining protein MreC [Clostridia bacterium]|nr:rod shape-determining protein MreC [Clostridia bacterium]